MRRQAGITLIEVLVAVLILGFLASIVMPAWLEQKDAHAKRQHDQAARSDKAKKELLLTDRQIVRCAAEKAVSAGDCEVTPAGVSRVKVTSVRPLRTLLTATIGEADTGSTYFLRRKGEQVSFFCEAAESDRGCDRGSW